MNLALVRGLVAYLGSKKHLPGFPASGHRLADEIGGHLDQRPVVVLLAPEWLPARTEIEKGPQRFVLPEIQ
jgi:hypothetical protein